MGYKEKIKNGFFDFYFFVICGSSASIKAFILGLAVQLRALKFYLDSCSSTASIKIFILGLAVQLRALKFLFGLLQFNCKH